MAKKIYSSDLFGDDLFAKQAGDAIQFEKLLKEILNNMQGIARTSAKISINPNNSATIAQTVQQFNLSASAAAEYEKVKQRLAQTEAQLELAMSGATNELIARRKELSQLNAQIRANQQVTNEQIGAYQKASNELARMSRLYKDLVIEQKHNTESAKNLKTQIDALRHSVIEADTAVGQYHRNVGNYGDATKRTNQLMFQTSQILREMPNFAISARVGFMSLSNNLPMLVDEFKKLNAINKELKANGEQTIPVWKTIGQSIFSFQGIVILATVALTAFGDKIGDFFTSLFSGSKYLEKLNSLISEHSKEIKKAGDQYIKDYVKEATQIKTLMALAQDEVASKDKRLEAIKALNLISPEYLGNIDLENVKTDEAVNAIDRYIFKLLDKAKAQAYFAQLVKTNEKIIDAEQVRSIFTHGGEMQYSDVEEVLGKDVTRALIDKGIEHAKARGAYHYVGSSNGDEFYRLAVQGETVQNALNMGLLDYQIAFEKQQKNLEAKALDFMEKGTLGATDIKGVASILKDKKTGRNTKDKTEDNRKKLGQDLAKAEWESMIDGYVKESIRIRNEYEQEILRIEDDFAGLTGADDISKKNKLKGFAEDKMYNRLDEAQKKANDRQQKIYDEALDKQRKNNQIIYDISLDRIRKQSEIEQNEATAKANELLKITTDGEKRKQIEKKLSDDILKIKIKQLESEIELAKLGKDINGTQIQDLELAASKLKVLKSELGLDKDGKEKDPKKAVMDTLKSVESALKSYDQMMSQIEKRREQQLDRQIAKTRRRQDELKALANLGQKDAKDNLAYEERKEAEMERKREQLEKRQQRRQMAIAAFSAMESRLNRGDTNAVTNTIGDVFKLIAAIGAMPVYFDGTEDTGNGGNADSKGGFLAVLHPNERVMTKQQNAMIGDISNEDLAALAMNYRMGFGSIPINVDAKPDNSFRELKSELIEVRKAIENKPVPEMYWDDQEKAFVEVLKSHNRIQIRKQRPGGGLWRS